MLLCLHFTVDKANACVPMPSATAHRSTYPSACVPMPSATAFPHTAVHTPMPVSLCLQPQHSHTLQYIPLCLCPYAFSHSIPIHCSTYPYAFITLLTIRPTLSLASSPGFKMQLYIGTHDMKPGEPRGRMCILLLI